MKYKIGDRVKIISAIEFTEYIGQVGIIKNSCNAWKIEFSNGEKRSFQEEKIRKVYRWIKL